jgi:hypothetical protein
MPIDRERYPKNWNSIATSVKEAVGWRCQHCFRLCLRSEEKPPGLTRSEWTKATLSVPERQLHPRKQPAGKFNCSLYSVSPSVTL